MHWKLFAGTMLTLSRRARAWPGEGAPPLAAPKGPASTFRPPTLKTRSSAIGVARPSSTSLAPI
eukprot:7011982-Pyramimonas_sp.AAC.1